MTSESRLERDAPQGARQLTAILPNGRTIWLRVARPLAPAVSANQLAALARHAVERRQAAIAAQAAAAERLSAAVAAGVTHVERARLARVRAFRRRLVAGDNALDVRLSRARDELRSRLDRQLKIDRENVRRLRRRDLWDKVLLATSLPLFAAYGERGSPFGSNNLTLTFLLLIWLAGDHVVDALFGSGRSKSPYALADADAWSYLAPIGNVLAAWWLLGNRQHERFVTGVTTVALEHKKLRKRGDTFCYRYRASVNLGDRIGKDDYADFETFTGVPAVATVGAVRFSADAAAIDPRIENLEASVDEGILTVSFRVVPQRTPSLVPSVLGEIDIAWMVDTDKPSTGQSGK